MGRGRPARLPRVRPDVQARPGHSRAGRPARRSAPHWTPSSLDVGTAVGTEQAVVVLPLHPLRLAWIAAHHGIVDEWCDAAAAARRLGQARDLVVDEDAVRSSAADERPLRHGRTRQPRPSSTSTNSPTGRRFCSTPRPTNHEAIASSDLRRLGLHRESTAITSPPHMVASRLQDFRRSHPVHDRSGSPHSTPATARYSARQSSPCHNHRVDREEVAIRVPPRVEVAAYGTGEGSPHRSHASRASARAPARPGARSSAAISRHHWVWPCARPRHLLDDARSNHVALVQDVAVSRRPRRARGGLQHGSPRSTTSSPRRSRTRVESQRQATWVTSPALTSTADARRPRRCRGPQVPPVGAGAHCSSDWMAHRALASPSSRMASTPSACFTNCPTGS